MIVRILGHGQLEVDDSAMEGLNALDSELLAAVERGDEQTFRTSLSALVDRVSAIGRPVADDALLPSDVVLPDPAASIEEVRELLGDEGLIPG